MYIWYQYSFKMLLSAKNSPTIITVVTKENLFELGELLLSFYSRENLTLKGTWVRKHIYRKKGFNLSSLYC